MKHETSSYGRILYYGMFCSWPASWLIFSQARRKELPPKHHPYSRIYYHAPALDTHNTEISVSIRELLTKKSFLSGIARITSPTPHSTKFGQLVQLFLTPKTPIWVEFMVSLLMEGEGLQKEKVCQNVGLKIIWEFKPFLWRNRLKIQLVKSSDKFGQIYPIFIL